ncbi:MAG: prepilin-type N-terminal cleavage/methylation domain-containing protein, partial [Gammaproteobacteria bacterium]|nr:prepilin-type N-terminal cleavage/methylation domain-containing protein [Gammaproteobacteria bacterium]
MQTPKGFTLPELLVVLALITITLTQVSTNLTDTFDQTKLLTIQHELGQQLQLARSEAIKRNRKVTLCKSDLDTQCNTSAEWESGWILFENIDGDGNIDGDDTILTKHHALSSGITVRGVGNFKNRVTYKPTGDSTSFSRLVLCSHNQLN